MVWQSPKPPPHQVLCLLSYNLLSCCASGAAQQALWLEHELLMLPLLQPAPLLLLFCYCAWWSQKPGPATYATLN